MITYYLLGKNNFVPIADHNEYRPPTQSQNSNMLFSASIPNSATFGLLVERATKCFATALSYTLNTNMSYLASLDGKKNIDFLVSKLCYFTYILCRFKKPQFGCCSIGYCFLCGKCFGGNDK